ncbi:MAG: A/G-specific adenine glycosylase [Myxococcota bacterium]|jgi:A/G-specific adenine glycosylase|nr:A/G-specific adenine glycosylase [Myxococcota bacterium]
MTAKNSRKADPGKGRRGRRYEEAEIPLKRLAQARVRLLDWYDRNARDLPWRRTRDPYAIWISETMLQQTRVDTVIPYYTRFLERFPDVESLADADLEEVYALWTGLGYYSRARNLHGAAQSVVTDWSGELPERVESLRELKGIGRYTAGALASIAFGREEALVDGNVIRVLARFLAVREDVGETSVVEYFWRLASAIVVGERPGDLNQALMELGATICTPRSPDCEACPLAKNCAGRAAGDPAALPLKKKRTRVRRVEAVAAWIERRGRVLAVRRPEGGLLGGLWELPGGELEAGEAPDAGLHRSLAQALGLRLTGLENAGEIGHLFSHRRLRLHVFRGLGVSGRVRREGFAEHRWLTPSALAALPHGGPTRKALALLGVADPESHRSRLRQACGEIQA